MVYPKCHRCKKRRKGRYVKKNGKEVWRCLACDRIKERAQQYYGDLDLADMRYRRWGKK